MTGGIVLFGGTRGGVGKTVMSHSACLGAILHNQPAVYVLTDPLRKLRTDGRPYGVLDGREPLMLARILKESRNGSGGWTIIDGGGNRPAFDEEVAAAADLCILPFRASDEDLDVVGNDLVRIPKAIAWPICSADKSLRLARGTAPSRPFREGFSSPRDQPSNSGRQLIVAAARRITWLASDRGTPHGEQDF